MLPGREAAAAVAVDAVDTVDAIDAAEYLPFARREILDLAEKTLARI